MSPETAAAARPDMSISAMMRLSQAAGVICVKHRQGDPGTSSQIRGDPDTASCLFARQASCVLDEELAAALALGIDFEGSDADRAVSEPLVDLEVVWAEGDRVDRTARE